MKLFTHQETGAAWLAARGKALLGDIPGMGKTYTAIEAMRLKGSARSLIVCPAIAKSHWARSLADAHYGQRAEIVSFDKVTSEGLAGMARRILTEQIDTLVVDEFHYCKTATSQRAGILLGASGYARRLEHVIGLSGSIPKHPGEFFNILVSLFPALMTEFKVGTREAFLNRYTIRRGRMVRGHWVEKVVDQQHVDELKLLMDLCMIKRTLEDAGLDVPAVWWQTTLLDGGAAAFTDDDVKGAKEDVEQALFQGQLEDIATDPHIARMRRRLGEIKAPMVVELLRSQLEPTTEKIVLFAHHRSVLSTLARGLSKTLDCVYVDGDTSEAKRIEAVDRFQSDPNVRAFIGQNEACKYSLTLTAAHRAVLVEPSFTADTNYQLGQRIARIGSTATHCIGQMIALAGTLDEAIVRQNERETRMAADLFSREVCMHE